MQNDNFTIDNNPHRSQNWKNAAATLGKGLRGLRNLPLRYLLYQEVQYVLKGELGKFITFYIPKRQEFISFEREHANNAYSGKQEHKDHGFIQGITFLIL
jgi:hypothetical protein